MLDVTVLVDVLNGRFGDLPPLTEADWQEVVEEADGQGVAPAIYVRLKNQAGLLPPSAAQKLRGLYLAGIQRNMRLFHLLGQTLKILEAAHIPVVPLKGAYLAATVYGNMALRQMGDVDLLFKREDLPRVLELLQADGYVSAYSMDGQIGHELFYHLPPMSKPGGFTLEAHWTIVFPQLKLNFGDADITGIWARVTPAQIAGSTVLALAPEDMLLHLCLHTAVHHSFNAGLINFLDIKEVIASHHDDMRWDEVIARARQWGIANGVYLSLLLAREWTDAAVPEPVMDTLRPLQPDSEVYEWVRHKVLKGVAPAIESNVTRLEGASLREKLSAVKDSLFQSRHSIARMYPVPADSWRIYLCYLSWFKVQWKRYYREIWRLLRRDRTLVAQARSEVRLKEWLRENQGN